jgi:uncharacterized protein (TIGR02145 family)
METLSKTWLTFILVFLVCSCRKQDNTQLPDVSDPVISSVTVNSLKISSSLRSDGGTGITKKGICLGLDVDPSFSDQDIDLTDSARFACSIAGLSPNTTYHFRAYAVNKAGVGYSNDVLVKTYAATDIDGNAYYAVLIGDQTWMSENLKSTRFRDGSEIPNVTGNLEWNSLKSPGYCWYDNDMAANKDVYGALYNWYAVSTGKLCPDGWHVPTNGDWIILMADLKGAALAAYKLRETGTSHWFGNGSETTNESGFTALPAGDRGNMGIFGNVVQMTFFWHSEEYSEWGGQVTEINLGISADVIPFNKELGASVRCIKD